MQKLPAAERHLVTVDACPVCESEWARARFALPGVGLRIVDCTQCGLGRVHPRPDAELIAQFYPPSYYGVTGAKFVPLIEALVRLVGARHVRALSRGLRPARTSARRRLRTGCVAFGVGSSRFRGTRLRDERLSRGRRRSPSRRSSGQESARGRVPVGLFRSGDHLARSWSICLIHAKLCKRFVAFSNRAGDWWWPCPTTAACKPAARERDGFTSIRHGTCSIFRPRGCDNYSHRRVLISSGNITFRCGRIRSVGYKVP